MNTSVRSVRAVIMGAAVFGLALSSVAQPPLPRERARRPGPRPEQRQTAVRTPAVLKETDLRLTIGRDIGPLNDLLGINAGPSPSGEPGNADLTEAYRWAGIREVRTQDFYGPLDMSTMYPDLKKDPASPRSYDFGPSDRVFAAITNAGAMPYFRIGDSYNNARIPGNAEEFRNFAAASVQVVKHYRPGTLNGAAASFRYVEIGNEPDNRKFWPGRYEDFFPYFVETFRGLKRALPDLKVGGPGFVVSTYKIPAGRGRVAAFLQYMKQNGVRPDFISFHLYSDDPAEYYDLVNFYRGELRKQGMDQVELHVSEWSTESGGMEVRVGRKAAPFLTACWIALHQAGADRSYLFRGTDTNIDNPGFYGIFHADGQKKPGAQAFYLWSLISKYRQRAELKWGNEVLDAEPRLTGDLKPVWGLAGRNDDGSLGILLANIGERPLTYRLDAAGAQGSVEVTRFGAPRDGLRTSQHGLNEAITLELLSIQFVRVGGKDRLP